jgi:hypothetical protein
MGLFKDKGNAGDWAPSDAIAQEAELDAISNPSREVVMDTGGKNFKSNEEALEYIIKHKLNETAARHGGTIGPKKIRGRIRIVADIPKIPPKRGKK